MTTQTGVKPYREVIPTGDGTAKLRLNLHPGQQKAWASLARFPVILAGTQWGKTCFIPDWLNREISQKGEGDYIVGSATFPLLGLKVLPEFQTLFCDLLHWGSYKDDRMGNRIIQSNHDKTRIIFFSATNPEAMESATAKAAVLDEAGQKQFRQGTWEAVQRRLSISQGRCLFATTLYQLGWLKTEVYDRAMAGDTTFEIIHGDSIDNPAFPQEEYYRQKQLLPAWRFDMFYRGRYSRPVGMVFDCFNEADDVIDRFEIPKNWLIYVGHDFGEANPAAMFYAQDPGTSQFYAFQEYLPGPGRSVYDHVQEFKRITKGYNVIQCAGGNWTTEDEIRQAYTAQGWHIQKPKWKQPQQQYELVYGFNKLHKVKVFRDLHHYLDQKTSFSYELDEKYQPTDKYDNEATMHLLACLTADTLIRTSKGQIPIAQIKKGDLVHTRLGLRRVLASQPTGKKPILKAMFSDGKELFGTAEHKVWVGGKGFIPLTALRYNDTISIWKEKRLSTMELPITDTQTLKDDGIESTFTQGGGVISIGQDMKMPMESYRRDFVSTIKMITRSITNYLILNVNQMAGICQTICEDMSTIWNTYARYAPLLLRLGNDGREPLMVSVFSAKGQRNDGKSGNQSLRPVNTVVKNIRLLNLPIVVSVHPDVEQEPDITLGWIQKSGYAQSVSKISLSTDTHEPSLAQENVVRCLGVQSTDKVEPVYDICVEDAHEFYANGILVHNCERYILSNFVPETVVNRDRWGISTSVRR